MKKLLAGLALLSAPALALAGSYEQARVLESVPVYRSVEVSVPREHCRLVEVERSRHHGYRSGTPTVLGAVIGGALGNAVGNGKSNKRVGAVVGAVLGGSIGRDLGHRNRPRHDGYYDRVERCETVYELREEEELLGYDVRYRYNGREYSTRLPDDPGATLRVRVDVIPASYRQ